MSHFLRRGFSNLPFRKWIIAIGGYLCLIADLPGQAPLRKNEHQTWDQYVGKIRQKTTQNREKAFEMARKQGWASTRILKNGRIFVLQGLDLRGQPIYLSTHAATENILAARSTRTSELHPGGASGLNLSGSDAAVSNRLGIWDGGLVRPTHREFTTQRILPQDTASTLSDHATHLAGTLIARGANPVARGMAFGAQLKTWDFTDDLAEMTKAAPTLLVSNHSYGIVSGWVFNPDRPGNDDSRKWEWWGDDGMNKIEDYKFGFYDTKARDFDQLAFLQPQYLIVKSADNKRSENGPPAGTPYFLRNTNQTSTATRSRNDGYDVIPSDATAKNILTVGAVYPPDDDFSGIRMTEFSGWGPADDGRIKPDLVGVGVGITSSSAASDEAYTIYTGTSVATPNVAGSLLLLQELYARQNGKFMRAATLKGLVLHTAEDAGTPGPDYQFGWGLLNARRATDVLTNARQNHLLLESSLRQGSAFTKEVIASGNAPLTVTISWTDPEGTLTPLKSAYTNSLIPKLINDLDLRLSDGTTESLPWMLNPLRPANAAQTGNNIRDNVEQILITNPKPGAKYTITVRHKNNLQNGNQPFSLFVSGIGNADCGIKASATASGNTVLCIGGSVKLSAGTGTNYRYQWQRDSTDISDATLPTYTAAQPGLYRAVIRLGNCAVPTETIHVTASAVKAVVEPADKVQVCSGQVAVLRAVTQTDATYQWLRNEAAIFGETDPILRVEQPARYALRVTLGVCPALSAPISVTVGTLKVRAVVLGDSVLCPGKTTQLKADAGAGFTYQWLKDKREIKGATEASYEIREVGGYAVRIATTGCQAQSKPVQIRVRDLQAFVVAKGKPQICPDKPVLLSSNTGTGYRYQWLRNGEIVPGAERASLTARQDGNYQVRITQGTCRVESPALRVTAPPLEARITPAGSASLSPGRPVQLRASAGGGYTYQWLRNGGNLPKANSATYLATQAGRYAVRVTVGICSLTSPTVSVTGSAGGFQPAQPALRLALPTEPETGSDILRMFPNPTNGLLTVEFSTPAVLTESPSVSIFSIGGAEVVQKTLHATVGGLYSQTFDLRQLPAGTYTLRVWHDGVLRSRSFVKQ
ncbi:MAG: S8 family serine peptidase [Cytophagaceae bacterium]|nr:S8 family serine peptidase [Cytophagaceae bacterium]